MNDTQTQRMASQAIRNASPEQLAELMDVLDATGSVERIQRKSVMRQVARKSAATSKSAGASPAPTK